MRGVVAVQVADASAVEVARSQNATSEARPDCDRDEDGGGGDDDDCMQVRVTYGQSAWCEP